jgi:hypothetical protein
VALARALSELREGAPLPTIPTDLSAIAEVDDGRLEASEEELIARLSSVASHATATWADDATRIEADVFADRRLPLGTYRDVASALARSGFTPHLVVRGPPGPARLPLREVRGGDRLCLRSRVHLPSDETPATEPELHPLEAAERATRTDHPCSYQRSFLVTVRDDGYVVTDARGTITPGCRQLQTGGAPVVTVPKRHGRRDDAALAACLTHLRSLFPEDEHVQLEIVATDLSVDDYVRTFRTLRGPATAPIFRHVVQL